MFFWRSVVDDNPHDGGHHLLRAAGYEILAVNGGQPVLKRPQVWLTGLDFDDARAELWMGNHEAAGASVRSPGRRQRVLVRTGFQSQIALLLRSCARTPAGCARPAAAGSTPRRPGSAGRVATPGVPLAAL